MLDSPNVSTELQELCGYFVEVDDERGRKAIALVLNSFRPSPGKRKFANRARQSQATELPTEVIEHETSA